MKLAAELNTAVAIAGEAMALIRTFTAGSLRVEHKAGDEPVTEADRAANDLIVARLRAAFPDDAILSEELPDDPARLVKDRVWMVDPIDGTRDFIRGDTGYAVMIGLCVAGRPMMGVVAQPPTQLVWAGAVDLERGNEAWKAFPDGTRVPLRPSALEQPPGIRLVASKSHRTGDIDSFRAALGIDDEMNIGGVGLKVGLVAEGTRDLYVYPGGRTKKWDTCAPEAVLVAAGGRLTDTHGGLIDYTEQNLYNRGGIVASNGRLHDMVVSTIATLRAGRTPPRS